jgi:tape measure domain-containing protein
MIVRELITKFGFNVDTSAQSRVESSINRISGLLSGIAAFASLRALANVADSMQSLEARIGMLPQTIGNVGDAFNEVARNASANRQSIEAYGTLYTRIGHAAKDFIKDQKDLVKVSNTISQALVVGGATTQEAQSVMLQFSQALGSGTLQGEEFRAMAEAAPQYLDALAEALNVPRGEMKKLASEGKITTKQVIEATLKMSSAFEEKFRQMPMTIGAATTIVGNKFKTMIAGMNRESQAVTDIANLILKAFDKISVGFDYVINSVGGLKNALKLLGIAAAALLGPVALGGLITILGAILSPAALVIGALIGIGLVIDDILTWMDGGESTIGEFFGSWETASKTILPIIQGFINFVKTAFNGLWDFVSGIAKLIWGAFTVNPAMVVSGLIGIVDGVVGIFKTMNALVVGVIDGAMLAIAGIIMGVGTVFKFIFWDVPVGWIMKLVNFAAEKIKGIGGAIGGMLGFNVPSVAPASVATAGKAGNVVTSNQTVNLTVPPGTPESQQKFLQTAAATAFKTDPLADLSRNLAIVAP